MAFLIQRIIKILILFINRAIVGKRNLLIFEKGCPPCDPLYSEVFKWMRLLRRASSQWQAWWENCHLYYVIASIAPLSSRFLPFAGEGTFSIQAQILLQIAKVLLFVQEDKLLGGYKEKYQHYEIASSCLLAMTGMMRILLFIIVIAKIALLTSRFQLLQQEWGKALISGSIHPHI